MNCTACGNTGLVPFEKGPAGATFTVLRRCKCQTDIMTITRAQYEALWEAAKALEEDHSFDTSELDTCPRCQIIAALRAAGIRTEGGGRTAPMTDISATPCDEYGKHIADALPRLTAPALPEDIARLIERLKKRVNGHVHNSGGIYTHNDYAEWKAAATLQAQAAEIERLHERLEDNHLYEFNEAGEEVRVEVKPGSIPDGIECRNETIKIKDENIDRLRKRIAELETFIRGLADETGQPFDADLPTAEDVRGILKS